MSGNIPIGKSIFVWTLERVIERWGSLESFVNALVLAQADAVLLKLVEGRLLFNQAHADEFILLCREMGIEVHGWSYNYGETNSWRENNDQTDIEAKLSADMVEKYNLSSWLLNCEKEWKGADGSPTPWRDEALEVKGWYEYFWADRGIDVPIGFTSFKYPASHNLPWEEFLLNVDYWVPQVYWQGNSSEEGPIDELEKSIRQYRERGGDMPIIPAGTIYKESNWPTTGNTWWPSPAQVQLFAEACAYAGLDGVTFWECAEPIPARPELWDAFEKISWAEPEPEPEPEPGPDLLEMVMENSLRLTVIEAGIVALADTIRALGPVPTLPPPPPPNGNGSGEPLPDPEPLPEPPPAPAVESVELYTVKGETRCYLSYSVGMNKGGSTGIPRMIMDFYPEGAQADDRVWWRNDRPILVEKGAVKTDGGQVYYKVVYNQQHRIPLYAGPGEWPKENGKPVELYISNKYIQ